MEGTDDVLDLPLDMITDISSMPPPRGLSLSASGVLHRIPDNGSVSRGLSPDSLDLPQPKADASVAWTSTKLHLTQHLPGPRGGNIHPTHHTTVAQDASSPHLLAAHGTATLVVLPFSRSRHQLYGMSTMYSQQPSQAPVNLPVVLASSQHSQENPVVTGYQSPRHPTPGPH